MVRLLVADAVSRTRLQLLWWFMILFVIAGSPVFAPAMQMAGLLLGALATGPFVVRPALVRREILIQPVSARQIWLAQWIASTLVSTLLTTASTLPAIWRSGAERTMLAGLCAFALSGACAGCLALGDMRPRGPHWYRRLAIWVVALVRLLGPVAAVVAIFTFREDLPQRWGDLAGPAGLVVAIGLALTVVGYRHAPAVGARSFRAGPIGDSAPSTEAPRERTRLFSRFTGLRYLFWREALGWLIANVAIMLGTFLLIVVFNGSAVPAWQTFQEGFRTRPDPFAFYPAGWLPLLVMTAVAGLPGASRSLRVLRALPLSASGASLLLVLVSAVRVLMLWVVLLVGAVFATGQAPASLDADLLVCLIGLVGLAHAMKMRGDTFARVVPVLILVGMPAVFLASGALVRAGGAVGEVWFARWSFALPAALGAAAIVGAVLLNRDTLMRRRFAYQAPIRGELAGDRRAWSGVG